MVASTKAPSLAAFVIVQPSPRCHGGARPRALSGLFGTVSVQFNDAAACAAVWFRLMAAPVPSTGLVATSPSWRKAVRPLAKLAAGGTTAVAAVPTLPVLAGQGEAEAEALAAAAGLPDTAAAGLPDTAGLADAEP